MRFAPLLCLAVLSCDVSNAETIPDGGSANLTGITNQSGSRIKVLGSITESEDGARVVTPAAGYFDSQLGVNCSFTPAADGQTRCLPATYAPVLDYADSACSQLVVGFGTCTAPPKYAVGALPSTPATGCGVATGYGAVSVGGAVTATMIYGKDATGTCSGGPNPYTGYTFYSAQIVPPSMFVAGTTKTTMMP